MKPGRLRVLKDRGVRSGVTDSEFFTVCARQLQKLAGIVLTGYKLEVASAQLVHCLYDNLALYEADCNWQHPAAWNQFKTLVATCKMFVPANLPPPFALFQRPSLVGLQDSGELVDHPLIGNATAVISAAMNMGELRTTAKLRTLLGLPEGPQLAHVATHLVQTVAAGLASPEPDFSGNDMLTVQQLARCYAVIVDGVNTKLVARQGLDRELQHVNTQLASHAWVLLPDGSFVRPNQLCFDFVENSVHGKRHCFFHKVWQIAATRKGICNLGHVSCIATLACMLLFALLVTHCCCYFKTICLRSASFLQ